MKFLSALAIVLLFSTGCIAPKMRFDANVLLPADFVAGSQTLLFERWQNDDIRGDLENKKMMEYLTKNYPYKFELATIDEIKSKEGKYSDLSQYRFAVLLVMDKMGGINYGFLDRSNGKVFPNTNHPGSKPDATFKPFINTILQKFPSR